MEQPISISNEEHQQNTWNSMKNSIIQKVSELNVSNFYEVTRKLYLTNIYRGRGVLTRAVIEAQKESVSSTPIYAALFANVNVVFPVIGELLLRRLIWRYKQGQREDSFQLKSPSATFISYLYYHQVVNESLVRQILVDLLANPNNISLKLVVAILSVCAAKMGPDSRVFLGILSECRKTLQLDPQTIYMIDGFLATFSNYNQANCSGLFESKKGIQVTHVFQLYPDVDPEDHLDEFAYDPKYTAAENYYLKQISTIFSSDNNNKEEERRISNKYQSSKLSRVRRRLFQ